MRQLFLILVLHSIVFSAEASGPLAGFPLSNHPWYEFMERRETSGRIRLQSSTRPFSVLGYSGPDMVGFVGDGGSHNDGEKPTWEVGRFAWELTSHLRVARGGFVAMEITDTTNSSYPKWPRVLRALFEDGTHAYTYQVPKDSFAFSIQPVYGLEIIETDDERGKVSRFTGGFRVAAGYDRRLYGFVDFRDHTEAGNGPYDSRARLYEDRWAAADLKGNSSTSYDISESMLQYYGRHLSVSAGRGRHKWGPGYFGGLLLNDFAPPFDYARFDLNVSRVSYTFLHGFLHSMETGDSLYVNPDGRPRTLSAEKFLSAQRIEVTPRDNILLGFSQSVVYGDRGVQLGYLTPLNFLYSVQHSNDDKDNLLLALDGKWRPVQGVKLYGELLLDDVLVGDLFSGTGNSKNAYTLGVHGMIPRNFWNHFDARLEYTKIRPFVYSHFFDVNTYSHWTSPLGYTREPNSEFMTARLGGSFYPFYCSLTYSRQNHGANTETENVGGSIEAPSYAGNDEKFPFLAGRFGRREEFSLSARYEILPNLNVIAQIAGISESRVQDRTEWWIGFGWNL